MILTPIEERALRHFRGYRRAERAGDGEAMRRQLKALLADLDEDASETRDVVDD